MHSANFWHRRSLRFDWRSSLKFLSGLCVQKVVLWQINVIPISDPLFRAMSSLTDLSHRKVILRGIDVIPIFDPLFQACISLSLFEHFRAIVATRLSKGHCRINEMTLRRGWVGSGSGEDPKWISWWNVDSKFTIAPHFGGVFCHDWGCSLFLSGVPCQIESLS
jgi:hypothetical protein